MKRTLQLAALALACVAASVAFASGGARGGVQAPTAINPAVTYQKNCAKCHGKDGRADTFRSKHFVHAQNLTDPKWQADTSDEHIFNVISNGKGKMPSFKRKLTTEQISSLVAYVRGLKR